MHFVHGFWRKIEAVILYSDFKSWIVVLAVMAVVGLVCLKGFGLKKAY